MLLKLLVAIAVLLGATNAAQAGPVERLAQLAINPSNPNVLVLRYANGGGGLLYSSDAGRTFAMTCTAAISSPSGPEGPIAVDGAGVVTMGTFQGPWQDDGKGCNWARIQSLSGRWVTDLVPHPSDPTIVFASTSNGGDGQMNGVLRRESGEWSDWGMQDSALLTRLRVTQTDGGLRYYASATRVPPPAADGGATGSNYVIRVSDDDGQSWEEHPFSGGPGSFRLEAVDPSNPDRIVASLAQIGKPGKLMVSRDRGRTFSDYLTLTEIGGVAFAPDGRAWFGEPSSVMIQNASSGLWFAESLDASPRKIGDYGVQCLAYEPTSETLYACQAFALGTVDDAGQFSALFRFAEAKQFVTCEGQDTAVACEQQLCADYCAAGHFAQAPLCCAYRTPSCGPLVAEAEGTGSAAMCTGISPVGGAGTPAAGAGGSAGSQAGASAGASAGGPAAGSGAQAGAAGDSASSSDDAGGCSCRTAGASSRSRPWTLAFGLLALGAARGRRRRSRAHRA